MSEVEYYKKCDEELTKLKGKKDGKKTFVTLTIQGIDDLCIQGNQIVLLLRYISLF